jgi:hypothetical protein
MPRYIDAEQMEKHIMESKVFNQYFKELVQSLIWGENTVDVVPVMRGEWIQHHETTTDNETLPYGWECSLCGRWEMEKQPFCNCGAKMEDKP